MKKPLTLQEIRALKPMIKKGVDVAHRLPFEARCEFEERLLAVARTLPMFAEAQHLPRSGVSGKAARCARP
eukprot:7044710-Alexandrium_andersonii.AAC.1